MKPPLIGIGIELDWPLPHHYDILRGILAHGRARGWNCRIHPGLETSQKIESLPEAYDGIIARASPALAQCCERLGVPLVNVWANSPDNTTPTVHTDYAAIGTLVANHLLSRGFRTFGFITRTDDVTGNGYLAGIQAAIAPHGSECDILQAAVPTELNDWLTLTQSMTDWLHGLSLPIAVIASDHTVARHFVDHCLANNFLVPDDIAVMSCKESRLICAGIEPEISSARVNYEDVGQMAVELLEKRMAGDPLSQSQWLVAPDAQIYERCSTDVHPVDDRVVARALRYIWDHSHQPMSVIDVAKFVEMSRRKLERRFRKTMDQSINDQITESRIERAKRLLVNSDDPIKFVAKAAGFSSGIRLAQIFAQHLATTPTAYRDAHAQTSEKKHER